ncbi:type II toxin-antitoxin system Phd/YefM family antitoxin [Megasphaera coli]|uniref:type II toxin-antitoxin system Phd/YefM family antitoxin n=1 Tax=Colibacter massiliensis TaxID=1852379 RepID=UPI00094EB95A|nr:type II toxin-antitoxin system Phd/YefM family antitoxin [Colibacter massiliensis]
MAEGTTINATTVRKELYRLITEVNGYNIPITITHTKGKNAVLLSEDDWRTIKETLYLQSVPGMVKSILEGDKEAIENMQAYNPDEAW